MAGAGPGLGEEEEEEEEAFWVRPGKSEGVGG